MDRSMNRVADFFRDCLNRRNGIRKSIRMVAYNLALLCLFVATSSHAIKCIQAGYTAGEGAIICHPSYIDATRRYGVSNWPALTFEPPEGLIETVSSSPYCGDITYDGDSVEVGDWSGIGNHESQRSSVTEAYHVVFPPSQERPPNCVWGGTGNIYIYEIERATCPGGYQVYGLFSKQEGGDNTYVCGNPAPAKECKKGDPVDIFSGKEIQDELHITGYGSDGLSLRWHYNSQQKPALAYLGRSVSTYPLLSTQNPRWMHDYQKRLNFNNYGIRPVLERVNPADTYSLYLVEIGKDTWADALGFVVPEMEERPEEPVERWKYTNPNGRSEYYDPYGRLIKETDSQGRATLLHYTDNRLTQVSNWKGQTLDFTYDADGVLESVTDSLGQVYRYRFNDGGLLTSVIFPDETPDNDTDNPMRSYRYENDSLPHALTSIVDENGQVAASWTYDANGRTISSSHAGGTDTTTFSYGGGSTTVTNALGKETTYYYDTIKNAYGVVLKYVNMIKHVEGHPSTNCAGANTDYEYNSDGYITKKTDWNGNITTYTRDAEGRVLSRTEALNTSEARTISTTWDTQLNKPLVVTEPDRIIEYTYDPSGQLLSKTQRPRH